MMFTDRDNRSFDHWPVSIPLKSVRGLVQDLLSTHPLDHRSLNGLFYTTLQWHSPIRKGPRLLRRALRSHSVRPSFPIDRIPESTDTWCSDSRFDLDDYYLSPGPYPDFAKFRSSVERLVHDRHFHDRNFYYRNYYSFSGFTMSDPPQINRFKRTRSLVSSYNCSWVHFVFANSTDWVSRDGIFVEIRLFVRFYRLSHER